MQSNVDDVTETRAMRERFPKPSIGAAAFQATTIVLFNVYLLRLVLGGDISPLALAAFAILDIVALSLIGNLAVLVIPKEARVGDPMNDRVALKLTILVLFFAFFVAIYYASVQFDAPPMARFLHASSVADAFTQLHIGQPLLVSAALTASVTVQDLLRWRRSGGLFVPGYAVPGAAKFLTLMVTPIPAVLISDQFLDKGPSAAAIAWGVTYVAIKCAFELLMLAFQCSKALDAPADGDRRRGE
ncbi:MAG: hypothetical protein ABI846_04970 [Rudaea sp.]